jgi:HK97 family phage major capsid protein
MPATASPLAKTIKVPQVLTRAAKLERGTDGKIEWVSISSDKPYKRYDWCANEYYYEVLSHKPEGIDTERLQSGLPVCFNHNTNQQLATAGSFKIENGKLSLKYDEFKWTSGEFTANKKADIESGALPHTSVSYELQGEGICTGAMDGCPVYEFKWKPYEGGPVVIPADASVGPGRSRGENKPEGNYREIQVIDKREKTDNTPPTNPPTTDPSKMKLSHLARQHFEADTDKGGGGVQVDITKERGDAVKEFRTRWEKIDAHVEALVSASTPKHWKAAAIELAKKHKAGEADFNAFIAELQPRCTFTTEGAGSNLREESHRLEFDLLPPDGGERQGPAMTVGGQVVNAKNFRVAIQNGKLVRHFSVQTDMSALGLRARITGAQRAMALAKRAGFTSSDLSTVNLQIMPQMVELGQERLTIMDLISPGTTSAAAIKYPQENTLGTVDGVAQTGGRPMAGMVGERGLKPNWEPDLTVETANVKKIAITTKVPDEFLQDFPGFQSYIDARLPRMVDNRAEQQVLYGDGLGDNLKGLMTFAGILTRAYATSWADTIRKAITDVEVGSFFSVDGLAFHPYDWEVASMEKDLEGRYIAGGPVYIQLGDGMFVPVRTYWGKPVVVTTAVTVGQPIVGAWKLGAQYFLRSGMELASTNANEDDFKRNLLCIRAEERLALACYRPPCFLEVTGGPART